MHKIFLVSAVLLLIVNVTPTYAQISRSAKITDADYHNSMQLMGGLGISYNASGFSGNSYIGLEGSFSLGSFSNRFNVEFTARPCFQIESSDNYGANVPFICPITVAPRLNICRVSTNSFYLYIQPEIGFAVGANGVYGGRFGFGWAKFGSFYIDYLRSMKTMGEGTKYASNTLFLNIGYSFYFWK